MLDVDKMIYDTRRYAFHRSVSVPQAYNGSVIRIYTDDVHAGYVRLIEEKTNTELPEIWQKTLSKLPGIENIHGPAILVNKRRFISEYKFPLSSETDDKAAGESIEVES